MNLLQIFGVNKLLCGYESWEMTANQMREGLFLSSKSTNKNLVSIFVLHCTQWARSKTCTLLFFMKMFEIKC